MLTKFELTTFRQSRFESFIKGTTQSILLLSAIARQVSADQRVIDGENLQSLNDPRRCKGFIYNLILILWTLQVNVLEGLSDILLHWLPSILVQYTDFVLNRVCTESVLHARLLLMQLRPASQDASFQRLRLLWVFSFLVFFSDHFNNLSLNAQI